MTYQQKYHTVSLVSSILILGYFLISVLGMVREGSFISTNVFRLWGIVIALTILMNIAGNILTNIATAIIQAIKTGDENPKIEDLEDERDKLIDLRGTRVAYFASSIGVFLAMLSFVLGQQPLVMFTLIIFFGLVAQILGDISKLVLYQRGF